MHNKNKDIATKSINHFIWLIKFFNPTLESIAIKKIEMNKTIPIINLVIKTDRG